MVHCHVSGAGLRWAGMRNAIFHRELPLLLRRSGSGIACSFRRTPVGRSIVGSAFMPLRRATTLRRIGAIEALLVTGGEHCACAG